MGPLRTLARERGLTLRRLRQVDLEASGHFVDDGLAVFGRRDLQPKPPIHRPHRGAEAPQPMLANDPQQPTKGLGLALVGDLQDRMAEAFLALRRNQHSCQEFPALGALRAEEGADDVPAHATDRVLAPGRGEQHLPHGFALRSAFVEAGGQQDAEVVLRWTVAKVRGPGRDPFQRARTEGAEKVGQLHEPAGAPGQRPLGSLRRAERAAQDFAGTRNLAQEPPGRLHGPAEARQQALEDLGPLPRIHRTEGFGQAVVFPSEEPLRRQLGLLGCAQVAAESGPELLAVALEEAVQPVDAVPQPLGLAHVGQLVGGGGLLLLGLGHGVGDAYRLPQ